jgi:glutamate decarboxylase
MADMLMADIANAVSELEKLQYPTPSRLEAQKKGKVFTH